MRALSAGVGVLALITVVRTSFGGTLPVITVQPTNQIVMPGLNGVLNISATGATSYQWRFDGSDISGATGASLTITNAQFTNAGYYYALAKSAVGWVPSQMAYLSVVDTPGTVPFNTRFHTNEEADYQETYFGTCSYALSPITNGTALLIAGPALDQMQPVGSGVSVLNGFFNGGSRSAPTVAAGQALYYQVAVSYPCLAQPSGVYTQLSTCVQTVAGGGAYSIPTVTNLYFPVWIEWPYFDPGVTSTNVITQVRIPGETFTLTNEFNGYTDLGMPTYQWRKGGTEIGSPSNFVCEDQSCILADGLATLTFTNFQPSNAGVYDVKVLGNNWMIGPKTLISVQLTNGPGVFQSPRRIGANFISDLLGAAGRNYAVQLSTNLSSWSDLLTLTNLTGTVTFTNPQPASAAFYRARLLPL